MNKVKICFIICILSLFSIELLAQQDDTNADEATTTPAPVKNIPGTKATTSNPIPGTIKPTIKDTFTTTKSEEDTLVEKITKLKNDTNKIFISEQNIALSATYSSLDTTKYSHTINLTYILPCNSEKRSKWTEEEITQFTNFFAETYKQCGIKVASARLIKIELDPAMVDRYNYNNKVGLEVASLIEKLNQSKSLSLSKPYIFLFETKENIYEQLYDGWCVPSYMTITPKLFESETDNKTIANTVWLFKDMQHKDKPPLYKSEKFSLVTHEVTHVLGNIYSYSRHAGSVKDVKEHGVRPRGDKVVLSHDLDKETNKIPAKMCEDIKAQSIKNGLIKPI